MMISKQLVVVMKVTYLPPLSHPDTGTDLGERFVIISTAIRMQQLKIKVRAQLHFCNPSLTEILSANCIITAI